MDDLPIFRCLHSIIYNNYLFFKLSVIIVLFAPINALSQEWVNKTPPGFQTYTGFFINNSTGWLSASKDTLAITNSLLLSTKDGAETFDIIYTFQDKHQAFLDLFMIDSLIGYGTVEGCDEFFWKTRDGGYTWENNTDTSIMNLDIGPIYPNSGFYFLDQDTGFFGGINAIFKTMDGGVNWSQISKPVYRTEGNLSDSYHVNEIFCIDFPGIRDIQFFDSVGYAYGIGFFLKYEDTLSFINGNEENVSNIELWPNPTNDIVNLYFNCKKPSIILFILFSSQGQIIMKLESILYPESNRITLSLKDEPSGLYFLIIQENDRILYRKIIKQ